MCIVYIVHSGSNRYSHLKSTLCIWVQLRIVYCVLCTGCPTLSAVTHCVYIVYCVCIVVYCVSVLRLAYWTAHFECCYVLCIVYCVLCIGLMAGLIRPEPWSQQDDPKSTPPAINYGFTPPSQSLILYPVTALSRGLSGTTLNQPPVINSGFTPDFVSCAILSP